MHFNDIEDLGRRGGRRGRSFTLTRSRGAGGRGRRGGSAAQRAYKRKISLKFNRRTGTFEPVERPSRYNWGRRRFGNIDLNDFQSYGFGSMNPTQEKVVAAKLLDWIKTKNPKLYSIIIKKVDTSKLAGFDGLIDSISNLVNKAITAAPAIFQTKAQIDLMKVNLDRAKGGLPPVETSTLAPTVKVQAEVTPEVTQKVITAAKETAEKGLNKILLWGGIGFGAFIILNMVMKRR